MGNFVNNTLIVLGVLDLALGLTRSNLMQFTLGLMEILAGMQGRELNKLRND